MTPDELQGQLQALISGWGGECVEFKEANDNFSTSDIGKYFSALSNEANLRGCKVGWLVFGVRNRNRSIVGTSFREDHERLHGQGTEPSASLREIHELHTEQGRILLLEIPAAPRGIPIAWNGHYYTRNGDSLVALALHKQDEIRRQAATDDWSAAICPNASLSDLDPDALAKARDIFATRFADRIPESTIRDWGDTTFLDQAKLTIHGQITRATVLLVGRREATHLLSPFVAELSWKLEGDEQDYEHFSPPFPAGDFPAVPAYP